jgi:cytochrome c556
MRTPSIIGLSEGFRRLGLQTHGAFDTLADQVKQAGNREDVITALPGLTGSCVACHAMYRLDEAH